MRSPECAGGVWHGGGEEGEGGGGPSPAAGQARLRLQLLYYLYYLDTEEEVMGGGQRAAERFEPAVYAALRRRSPLENCGRAARAGDSATMLGILGSAANALCVRPHCLTILACFPDPS